jgi:homogentisate 1,2-dioxygenase
MPFYQRQGELPRKKHITFYKPDSEELYKEELVSTRGFDGGFSTRYRLRAPTRVSQVKEIPDAFPVIDWNEAPLNYYHFLTDEKKSSGNFLTARTGYLKNGTMAVDVAHVTENTDVFYRNAYAHECWFVHYGKGVMRSEYGEMAFDDGDHLVIPKGVTVQVTFERLDKVKLLVMEGKDPFRIPRRYRNEFGQILEHAPYCERDFHAPVLKEPIDAVGEHPLWIKGGNRLFEYTLDHHPFDIVGWDGYEYPFTFSIKDFCPIVGKLHMPPPIHQVFDAGTFVVCNFVPRLFDFHPQAVPAPYFHTNIDSCEVIYYVDGDFMSRTGVNEGSITLHPTGVPHGPQPGKTEASIGKKETHEWAVMVDSFAPLHVTKNVQDTQVQGYAQSWLEDN